MKIRSNQRGVALITTLLVLMLMSALLVGFLALIMSDQMSSGVNRDQTQAYAAAHAGLEKLTADLGALFSVNFSPSMAQIGALTAAPPNLAGFVYEEPDGTSGYTITPSRVDGMGNPAPIDPNGSPIATGPYQGLMGLITPYVITVTVRTQGGSEVQMRREMQTISVPVFQFGIYSENDLSFFAGPNFGFGGRVHSNQNVYLAEGAGATLTLEDRVTAVGEVVRSHLANGVPIATSTHTGTVRMARASGCPSAPTAANASCRNLAATEGSVTVVGNTIPPSTLQVDGNGDLVMVMQDPNTPNEPTWTNLSVGTYNGFIRNGRTGARRLDLPIVSDGAQPIDLIRRPDRFNPDNATVLRQRFYSMASLRILLSDTAEDIMNLPGVDNGSQPISLESMADLTGRGYVVNGPAGRTPLALSWGSVAASPADPPNDNPQQSGYRTPRDTSLLGGFIKIERQTNAGAWNDVTDEILGLGFTGRNLANNGTLNVQGTTCVGAEPSPNAVIRLQRLRDDQSVVYSAFGAPGADACGRFAGAFPTSNNAYVYWPNVLYDAREAVRRDAEPTGQNLVYHAGVMHYVELDMNNLRRWLNGEIGVTGANNTMNVTGFVVYFSDRRGNRNFGADAAPYTADDRETGELGWEDFVNPASATSLPNGAIDAGEDMNGDGVLDVYGNMPRVPAAGSIPPAATTANASGVLDATVRLADNDGSDDNNRASWHVARMNRPVFFRRALKVVNAVRGNLPANGLQGVTVASENPVYVEGHYNATTAGFGATGDGHVSSAIIADAVTFLSASWNDIISFRYPHNAGSRNAGTTWYRLGIIAGKGLNFPRPTTNAGDHTDFGTDGGAHNFIRYIEDWGGQTLNYRGSIISFFTSRQAVGTYKCCDNVYSPPTRGYRFDAEFLNPNLLPPRTPMFRDLNTLTFRQLLRPTQ